MVNIGYRGEYCIDAFEVRRTFSLSIHLKFCFIMFSISKSWNLLYCGNIKEHIYVCRFVCYIYMCVALSVTDMSSHSPDFVMTLIVSIQMAWNFTKAVNLECDSGCICSFCFGQKAAAKESVAFYVSFISYEMEINCSFSTVQTLNAILDCLWVVVACNRFQPVTWKVCMYGTVKTLNQFAQCMPLAVVWLIQIMSCTFSQRTRRLACREWVSQYSVCVLGFR